MGTAVTETAAVQQAAETIVGRVAAMVRDLPGGDIPIPRSEWTVLEAAAHLAFTTLGMAMMARGLEIPYGDGTQEGLAAANELSLEGFSERDGAILADRMVAGARMVFEEAKAQTPGLIVPTPMGSMPVETLLSYLTVHAAMHGSAISTALDAPWPFDAEHVPVMWPFIQHVIPRVSNPSRIAGVTACYGLNFGDQLHCALMIDDGAVTMAITPTRPPDCVIAGDAQVLFLVLAKILTLQQAVASGDLTLTGPNPDLGYTLPSLFDVP